jgi:hypothetical protein
LVPTGPNMKLPNLKLDGDMVLEFVEGLSRYIKLNSQGDYRHIIHLFQFTFPIAKSLINCF